MPEKDKENDPLYQPDHPQASPRSGYIPPPAHRWKPGERPATSGEGGRKKGRVRITDHLKKIIEEKDDGKLAEALAQVIIRHAGKGNYQFMNMVMERLEGKVSSQVDVTSGGQPIKAYVGLNPDDV